MKAGTHSRRRIGCALACLALLWTHGAALAGAEIDLKRIDDLVRGGAPYLALGLLDRHTPTDLSDPAWSQWERRRLAIYESLGDWDSVTNRVDALAAELPDGFRVEAFERAAHARLAARDPANAQRFLRALIWNERAEPETLARWRRLVIRSYLIKGDLADAQRALVRYQHDYRARGDAWQVLQAEILLRQGKNKAAYEALAGIQTYESRVIREAAGLRAGILKPAAVLAGASKLAARLKSQPPLAEQAWLLAAEAAKSLNDARVRIEALEEALRITAPAQQNLIGGGADDLWRAYLDAAEAYGNRARFLVGQDERWWKAAEREKKKQPWLARALLAHLATRAPSEDWRTRAHEALADSLLGDDRGEVLKLLYTDPQRYARAADVPGVVRYRLADRALGLFDIKLAADMLKGLEEPPADADAERWSLRRARILTYAGDDKAALFVLSDLLDRLPVVPTELAEAFVQVLFDLQALRRHREAIVLFDSLYGRVKDERLRREILYWLAESRTALGQHREAAELYLRSATYNGASGGDMWGQTARFHAAEALGRAGLVNDARNVYRQLLRATKDPQRRALIERNIQQLWLAEQRSTTP